MTMNRKHLILATIVAAIVMFAAPAVTSAAPARRHHKPVPIATSCFYGGITGAACAGLPTPANDFDGRITPPRWDPCVPGSSATLIYLQPCTRRSPSVAGWCLLHFDHHSQVSASWCRR